MLYVRTYIIAEAGVNHNGCEALAHRLVDAAADAGADAVKFQTFEASALATGSVDKAEYQKATDTRRESQLQMLARLELAHASHFDLMAHARERGIDFLSTAFDGRSLDFLLLGLSLDTIKISSGELTNHPFLLAHGLSGRRLILSTGMATLDEIEDALGVIAYGLLRAIPDASGGGTVLGERVAGGVADAPSRERFRRAYRSERGRELLARRVSLLHCTSEYPTAPENVNLRAMQTLARRFGLPVGYSDHTSGVTVAGLAVAAGAELLEKHFTLDRRMDGPDHAMSLTPDDLGRYVAAAREAQTVMGRADKRPTPAELENRSIGRKLVVATADIGPGETLTECNIGSKRSDGSGMEPASYWELLGREAVRGIRRDEPIVESSIR